jgi:hypothetical protein
VADSLNTFPLVGEHRSCHSLGRSQLDLRLGADHAPLTFR